MAPALLPAALQARLHVLCGSGGPLFGPMASDHCKPAGRWALGGRLVHTCGDTENLPEPASDSAWWPCRSGLSLPHTQPPPCPRPLPPSRLVLAGVCGGLCCVPRAGMGQTPPNHRLWEAAAGLLHTWLCRTARSGPRGEGLSCHRSSGARVRSLAEHSQLGGGGGGVGSGVQARPCPAAGKAHCHRLPRLPHGRGWAPCPRSLAEPPGPGSTVLGCGQPRTGLGRSKACRHEVPAWRPAQRL